MKQSEWLKQAINTLETAVIDTARLDALVLLEDATGKDRAWLLAHPEFELDDKIATLLQLQIEKRAQHTPLAYIRGTSEFYGREFMVTHDTLQPRAETETMIDALRALTDSKQLTVNSLTIVDIGTGSGCLAITAKLEFPETEVYATEINQAAMKIAKQNAQNLHTNVTFLQGNLLEPYTSLMTHHESFVLLCNLPYVPDNYEINQAAAHEPRIALFGGKDGLDLYRDLFTHINAATNKPAYILTESLPFQHEALEAIAKKYGYIELTEQDFIQVFSQQQTT